MDKKIISRGEFLVVGKNGDDVMLKDLGSNMYVIVDVCDLINHLEEGTVFSSVIESVLEKGETKKWFVKVVF